MAAPTPEALHAALEDAFTRGDLDAYTAAYEDDATLVVPPEGRPVRGRAAIRAAVGPLFAGRNRMTSVVARKIEAGGLALTHARWELVSTDEAGAATTMTGRATMVSRRQPDGSWAIVLDDPLSHE